MTKKRLDEKMGMQEQLEKKLTDALSPQDLQVENESHMHAGHANSPGTGESHFRIHIMSDAFAGKSRLERHRLVNEVLAEELAGKIHALAVHAKAPGEA